MLCAVHQTLLSCRYADEEGDRIEVVDDNDLKEAIRLTRQSSQSDSPVRLNVDESINPCAAAAAAGGVFGNFATPPLTTLPVDLFGQNRHGQRNRGYHNDL